MKILAIESSGLVASCAVIEDDVVLGEFTTDFKKTHSETLLPMIDSLSRLISLDKSTLDFVAVSSGPGSFTGLRIGGTTAKGIAMALNLPIVSVPTLMGLSYNLWGADSFIVPLMDARRGEAYTGIYQFCNDGESLNQDNTTASTASSKSQSEEVSDYKNIDGLEKRHCRSIKTVLPETALPIEKIIEKVNENCTKVIFLGDGVPVFKEKISALCKIPYYFAPSSLDRQRASSVGALAMDFLRGQGIHNRLSDTELEKLRLPDIDEVKAGSDQVSDIMIASKTEDNYKRISTLNEVALFTADDFRPQYLRMSQAERERLEKKQTK